MLYLGDQAVGDMSDLPQLVGAMGLAPGAVPQSVQEAVNEAAAGGLAAVVAKSGEDRLDVIAGLIAAALTMSKYDYAVAIAKQATRGERDTLIQGLTGKPAHADSYGQPGDAIADVLRAVQATGGGVMHHAGLSTGAKVAIGVGVAAVLGLGVWAVARR